MEQTDIAPLGLEKYMLVHKVTESSSEKSDLESELRLFEGVIQQLTTNQAPATPTPPPGTSGNSGSPEPTSGISGTDTSAEPTPGPS